VSLRVLAAQTLCVGFEGASANDAPLERLRELGPGGLILFARNVTTRARTAELVAAVRAASGAQFVAVDQEGGRVARLRDDAVEIPAMMALGVTDDESLAERAGAQIGRDLRRIGVDVDFAPVADLALEPRNTVIGARAFGSDPQRTGALASSLARGLARSGIVATAKHFPGHGATEVDSHLGLPSIDADLATLRGRELVPFRACIEAGVGAVMAGHIVARAIDPQRPASLSKPAIGLLRGELRFEGAIFTDCIEMGAVAKEPGSTAAAVEALSAGVDCVVVSHHLDVAEAIVEAIVRAVETGRLTPGRLEEAASRVSGLHVAATPYGEDDGEIGPEIARRAVAVKRGRPVLAPGSAVSVISFEGGNDGVGDRERASLNAVLRRRGVKSEILRVPLEPQGDDIRLLLSVVEGLGARTFVIVMRRADLYPAQRSAIEQLLARRPEAILVSAREPYDASLFPHAATLVCTYGDQAVNFGALAELMVARAVR
jgi:beta-N-acetylhexosaminidase